MANNGFNNRRSNNTTRTYPGTVTRLLGSSSSSSSSSGSSSAGRGTTTLGSVPAVFVRPLSHSQLTTPVQRNVVNESSSPPVPPSRPISLDQPRPTGERHRNLYLGAPLPSHHHRLATNNQNVNGGSSNNSAEKRIDSAITAAEQVRLPTNSKLSKKHSFSDKNTVHSQDTSPSSVITCQPKKGLNLLEDQQQKVRLSESSIICPYCRKCRCEACATPRPIPSTWICSKSIHCGPGPCLDYVTCLCCVKAIFYHCGKNHEPDGGVICADKPCSCAPHRKFWRWGCMATMSLVLPCLCLYWPCKGCVKVVEKAYQRYHNNGCTCPHHPSRLHPRHEQSITDRNMDGPISIIDSSEDEDHHRQHFTQKRVHQTIGNNFSIGGTSSSHQHLGKVNKLLPSSNKTASNSKNDNT